MDFAAGDEVTERFREFDGDHEALLLESRCFRDLGDTEDLREGTMAFREKRQAVFKGR